jgi:hypothetical protein
VALWRKPLLGQEGRLNIGGDPITQSYMSVKFFQCHPQLKGGKMSIQGYCTLMAVLINKYGYKFDENNQPDKDELVMLALAEILRSIKDE